MTRGFSFSIIFHILHMSELLLFFPFTRDGPISLFLGVLPLGKPRAKGQGKFERNPVSLTKTTVFFLERKKSRSFSLAFLEWYILIIHFGFKLLTF